LTDLKPTQSSGQLGDIYNFGCPRVGNSDWSEAFYNAMESHTGTSVRVVNEKDLVPQLVPLVSRDSPPYFNHIDSGWNVFPNAPPKAIETERGTAPPALDWIWDWASDISDHRMVSESSFEEDLANYVEQTPGAITLL
jgi:Lipase (class 3)